MHKIAVLALPNAHSIEVTGPIEVFNEATRLLGAPQAYAVEVLGVVPEPISMTGGLLLLPNYTIHETDELIDTLIVASSVRTDFEPSVVRWLGERFATLRRCGAVGAGAFLFGAAGLLDGRHATGHWEHINRLAAAYPAAVVERDRIFVRDGSIYTSAGATAGLDLALELVEEDFGRDLALAVARRLVMFEKRTGGQVQVSAHLTAQCSTKSNIRQVQEWVLDNLVDDHSIEALARRSKMSPRNFSRVFRREAKMTPAAFVDMVRVQAARQMLEDTNVSLQRIAYACGFGNVGVMRRSFVRSTRMRPTEYRRKVRDGLASARTSDFVAWRMPAPTPPFERRPAERRARIEPLEVLNPKTKPARETTVNHA